VESHGHEWRTALGGDGVKCGAGGRRRASWRLGVAPRCCDLLIFEVEGVRLEALDAAAAQAGPGPGPRQWKWSGRAARAVWWCGGTATF
jgi:hypothetical protein